MPHSTIIMAAVIAAGPAAAQPCEPEWIPVGGPNHIIETMALWDPDGAGPAPPQLVVGGLFTRVGERSANRIAAWNPDTGAWSALGSGPGGTVLSLATLPNGDLVAGGYFGIARWDGISWQPLGGGISGASTWWLGAGVYALLTLPGGDLIAAGHFDTAGGKPMKSIARWTGESWEAMGELFAVRDLAVLSTGEIVAGTIDDVRHWDGVSWRRLGGWMGGGGTEGARGVMAVALGPGGDLIAGGWFRGAGETIVNYIAHWDGTDWGSLAGGLDGFVPVVAALATDSRGDVLVGGRFAGAGGLAANNIAAWNGREWRPLGQGTDDVVSSLVLMPGGDVAVGGYFATAGGLNSPYLAIWRDCPSCYADCDGSGDLTFFDFLCFQNLFAAMDPGADCDGDTDFTFFDFLCFQNAFAAGCP